jgi:Domain of unknown function (DUF4349)
MLEGNQMVIAWPPLWWKDRNWLEKLWLIAAGIAAIYYGAIQPRQDFRGIAESKATALAAIEDSRHQHWFQPNSLAVREELQTEGIVGGVPANAAYQTSVVTRLAEEDERKIVRTSSIALIVEKPADAARKIQQLAEGAGGFLVNWEANGAQEATSASLMIRVPVGKFESTQTAIRSLAQRVENERVEAEDASTQYVDDQARLRNLRAQETQYLAILRQARTVKDTLEVSDKLNQVRGEIERQQSEFNTLSKQVELVAISVSLRKETEAQVFGLPWRPLYEVKLAARMGLEGLIDYSTSILSFFFYLPAILLWMATILAGAAIGWRVLRWAGRQLFVARASTANR